MDRPHLLAKIESTKVFNVRIGVLFGWLFFASTQEAIAGGIVCDDPFASFHPDVCKLLNESVVEGFDDIDFQVSWDHHRKASYSCSMNEAVLDAQKSLKISNTASVPLYVSIVDFAKRVKALRSLKAERTTSILWVEVTPQECLEEDHVIIVSLRRRTEIVEGFKGCDPIRISILAGLRDLCDFRANIMAIRNLSAFGNLPIVEPGSIRTAVYEDARVSGLSKVFTLRASVYRSRSADIEQSIP